MVGKTRLQLVTSSPQSGRGERRTLGAAQFLFSICIGQDPNQRMTLATVDIIKIISMSMVRGLQVILEPSTKLTVLPITEDLQIKGNNMCSDCVLGIPDF